MAKCVICGRSLKTGRKYCYVHRSQQHAKGIRKKRNDIGKISAILFVCIFAFISSFFLEGGPKGIIRIISILIGFPVFIFLLVELLDQATKRR